MRSSTLAATDLAQALEVLDRGISQALAANNPNSCARLARHAGVLANGIDLVRALRYFETAIQLANDDPTLHFARGDVLRRLGKIVEAKHAFERSRTGAQHIGNLELSEWSKQALLDLDDVPP